MKKILFLITVLLVGTAQVGIYDRDTCRIAALS